MSSRPIGPKSPRLWQTVHFALRPYSYLRQNQARFGATFFHRFIGGEGYFFSDPQAIRQIFASSKELVSGSANYRRMAPLLGQSSLLVLDGAKHRAHRRLMQPAFHGESLRRYEDTMRELTVGMAKRWPRGRAFACYPELQALTLTLILGTVFGLLEPSELQIYRHAVAALLSTMTPLLFFFPTLQRDLGPRSPWGKFVRARARFDALLKPLIEARRQQSQGDILSLLVHARADDGSLLSEDELKDELLTLLLAGHDTTAASLAWALHWLTRQPKAYARLREEIHGKDDEAIAKVPYLDAVCKETLRLSPALPIVIRESTAPIELEGIAIASGQRVGAAIYLTHRRPELYPEPDHFKPERFLDLHPAPYAYFPFGGGSRRCIGEAFASLQLRIVLGTLANKVNLVSQAHPPVREARKSMTVAPSDAGVISLA